ncbi:uncharacterized protein [Clytia hemisphaerica]|uniref:uncharacterized protein n=1 Tax=Clytia hemisphaerica TaxID=252671 RepID=UPI0034D3AD60
MSEIKTYTNDEELEKVWMDGFQIYMDNARKSKNAEEEFMKQQDVYSQFANVYDEAIRIEKYSGPGRIAAKVKELFPRDEDLSAIKILDYGCGTGLVADNLNALGFKDIEGLDPNTELLQEAKKKNVMKKFYQMKSTDSHQCFETASYDVITSAGTFFLSASHPGFETVKTLTRIIKKGGYLILLIKNAYLECPFIDHTIIPQLEAEGVLKSFPKELFEGYRQAFKHEEDGQSMGAFLVYQILK